MPISKWFVLLPALALGAAAASAEDLEPPSAVDYTRDIKPILVQHCADCHGAELAESGLRLDKVGLAVRGGDRGPAVVPGKHAESLLFLVLKGHDDLPVMPLDQEPLTDEQIALIGRWIDQGAEAPEAEYGDARQTRKSDHWAFQPVVRPEHPAPRQQDPIRNPIDSFVLARLEKEGLELSPPAARATLIRRLSLDLLGLPPSPEAVDAFVADNRPGAYTRLVDRLLASPHYGERWGRHWLDVARYADSNGFTIDGPRSIWKYRDWVIGAVNADLTFDQFVVEQLAGDLLPEATSNQVLATGFHRNTLVNQEGGTDDEQFRVEAVVDRVGTTGTVFLGLTVACAQCHQHKYDPISQREFYQLFAFFNNTEDVNAVGPELALPTALQTRRQEQLQREAEVARKSLSEYDAAIAAGQIKWEQEVVNHSDVEWTVLDPIEFLSQAGAMIDRRADRSLIVGGNGNIPSTDTYVITTAYDQDRLTAFRLEMLSDPDLPNDGPGLADNGNFVLSEFRVSAVPLNEQGEPAGAESDIDLASCVSDWSQEGFAANQAIDGNVKTGWAVGVKEGQGSANVDREALFVLAEPVQHAGGVRLTFQLDQKHGEAKYLLGRLRISATDANVDAQTLPDSIRRFARQTAEERTTEQQAVLKQAYSRTDTGRQPLADRVNELTRLLNELEREIPTSMVLKERQDPRETHVMIRGDFLRKGARVRPDVPAVLPPLPADVESPTRLDLARWLVSPDNPLTSRVTVNRHWQHFFGLGLVETENDFGIQGTPPSHPELLDWLADEFQRLDWSVKRLHRLIVSSATYRQSSASSESLQHLDQANRLLARQSRLRLEAEAVRDIWLACSGQLTRSIGGPGSYPPQPQGINLLTQVSKSWPESQGGDRYRRGMYIYFWRSNPYPFLAAFDAPNATSSCTRRARSNTPLQALTLANDRAFVEIAKGLARRVIAEGAASDEQRVRRAFRICLAREPNDFELDRLTEFLNRQRESFEQDEKDAEAAAPDGLPTEFSVAEAASWTALARVLLNLDEVITRE